MEAVLKTEFSGMRNILRSTYSTSILGNTCLNRKKGHVKITGKTVLLKGQAIDCDLKKWCAFWKSTLVNGNLASGTTEMDACGLVLDQIYKLDNASEGDDIAEGEGDDADASEDERAEDKTAAERPGDWRPPHWWAFLIFGPYAQLAFGNNCTNSLYAHMTLTK